MRSTSTKPQTGADGGYNATSKASYMQATSSWAKKKSQIIKDKEEFNGKKNEQRKNFQNARGFTTLGHSSSTTQNFNSQALTAEIQSSRFGKEVIGGANGGSTTRNTRL